MHDPIFPLPSLQINTCYGCRPFERQKKVPSPLSYHSMEGKLIKKRFVELSLKYNPQKKKKRKKGLQSPEKWHRVQRFSADENLLTSPILSLLHTKVLFKPYPNYVMGMSKR